MSTELKSNLKDVSLTRFWGGEDRGTCIQVTTTYTSRKDDFFKHISLTREQALELAKDLQAFGEGQEQSEFEQQKDNYEDV